MNLQMHSLLITQVDLSRLKVLLFYLVRLKLRVQYNQCIIFNHSKQVTLCTVDFRLKLVI